DPGDHAAPGPAESRKLGLRLWQRGARGIRAPTRHWNSPGTPLRALRQRSLEKPADSQSPGRTRLVHSSFARLGFEFHDRDRADPHGAGVPFRSLQISERADLGGWYSSAAPDPRNGFYRPGASIR